MVRNNFSKIFKNCGNIEIGLYFVTSVFVPLLYIGITLAIFILDGNTPVLNEILQMCARGLQITDTTFATVSMLVWNNLSTDCVQASSVNMYKNKIDKYLVKAGFT